MCFKKENENEINISIVGGYYTGKTTFFDFIFERMISKDEETFGNHNQRKTIDIGKKQYMLNIIDTPGYDTQILDKEIAMKFSDIIIFIYDTQSFNTFYDIKELYDSINYPKNQIILDYLHSAFSNWKI